jgi:phospholipase C
MKLFCYVLSMILPYAVPAFAGVGFSGQATGSPAPTVTITANPTSITAGSSSVLTVVAQNATGITITGSNGSKRTMAAGGGSVSVSPTSATTYTATATGAGGTASASVTITITTSTSAPTVTVTANPTSMTKGSSSIVTVTATNATQVTLDGSNNSQRTLGATGATVSVSPTSTTTYTATATGAGGTASASVIITVTASTSAPTVTISANPKTIASGSSSVLTVTATNATGVTITGSDGSNQTLGATGGTASVSPTSTTTYTATATGAGGTTSASATITVTTGSSIQLTVTSAGTGTGTVTSSPAGINCPGSCSASFPKGTAVVLTAAAESGNTFEGWSGACTGKGTCSVNLAANAAVTATFEEGTAGITSIQHIVFFAQENRSLDNYFGAMREYWQENGIPDQSFDGLPQFNPTSGVAPLYGPPPAIPGCDPTSPYPGKCIWDPSNTVASFHMISVCNENTSPSWQEAHNDWDYTDPVGTRPAKNNGFVHTAAGDARDNPGGPFYDTNGIRAMGYWDGTDMNYDYFMASNFATSDRFFQPAMSRTEINREYLAAATSGGYALPNGSNAADTPQLHSTLIWQELQNAGISWKIYINPEGTGCAGPPYDPACLIKTGYLSGFSYSTLIKSKYGANIAPISEYFSDLENGTLPQVSEIEPASDAALDQHGSDSDANPENVQAGARYTSTLVNALMNSSSWEDSAFIFFFDESGGLYDHVPAQPTVSPDGIKPIDLPAGYICTGATGPICDFTYTGYRIPMTVISPYAKKNYVSHTVMDSTAILKFIETRFNLPALNNRDAAQPDMTEFFDFNNPPWMSPPTPPAQRVTNPCYLNKLP